jgi:hypothetical protein
MVLDTNNCISLKKESIMLIYKYVDGLECDMHFIGLTIKCINWVTNYPPFAILYLSTNICMQHLVKTCHQQQFGIDRTSVIFQETRENQKNATVDFDSFLKYGQLLETYLVDQAHFFHELLSD